MSIEYRIKVVTSNYVILDCNDAFINLESAKRAIETGDVRNVPEGARALLVVKSIENEVYRHDIASEVRKAVES